MGTIVFTYKIMLPGRDIGKFKKQGYLRGTKAWGLQALVVGTGMGWCLFCIGYILSRTPESKEKTPKLHDRISKWIRERDKESQERNERIQELQRLRDKRLKSYMEMDTGVAEEKKKRF